MTKQPQASGSQEPITSGVRSTTVDIVKGLAIILVVYAHTAQGMLHRGWWVGPAFYFSDAFIYSFHMPAFFVVAGLFVMPSIVKRGNSRFAIEKVRTILYPYLLFVFAGILLEPLIGRFKLSSPPFHWSVFLRSVSDGEALWFLYALFACLMLALLTRSVPHWLRFSAAALVGLLPVNLPVGLDRTLHEFCFLAAGMWIGNSIFRLKRISAPIATAGLALLTLFQACMIYRFGYTALWIWTYIPLGLTGTAALFLIARLIEDIRPGAGLAWTGRASLAIFLLAPWVQGATREILLRLHISQFWPQLLVPTFFAVMLPALVWHQKKRWRTGWLFQWPF